MPPQQKIASSSATWSGRIISGKKAFYVYKDTRGEDFTRVSLLSLFSRDVYDGWIDSYCDEFIRAILIAHKNVCHDPPSAHSLGKNAVFISYFWSWPSG